VIGVALDAANERLMAAVNATGEVFLSHTRLADRFAIRLAIGNLRTERRHVARAWELLRREAERLAADGILEPDGPATHAPAADEAFRTAS
jgi:aromatic-L-amino-acid decarboxylase